MAVDEKALLRKLDRYIMPFICVSYLMNVLDRVNLGNAATLNNNVSGASMNASLGLTGIQYNIAVSLFFLPYSLLEFPSNLFLKYFTPSLWIGRIMISWGIVATCTAFVTNFGGLLACRLILGCMEAGFFPGVLMYLCFWYKPSERATRMSIFAASVALAGATSGLIATGISYMNSAAGLKGWQWLFIIEGIPSVLVGIVILLFMPNYPETAKFLTPEEKAFAIERIGPYAPKGTDKHFDSKQAKKAFGDPWFWVYAIHYFFVTASINAFGYFAPKIVVGLGFSGAIAQAMTIPPNAFAFLLIIGNSVHSDYTHERMGHVVFGQCVIALGYLLLAVVTSNWGVRYLGVMLIACSNVAIIPFIAHRTRTVAGSTGTGLATGGMIAFANLSGIAAPYMFPDSAAPNYQWGNWVIFSFQGIAILLSGVIWWKYGSGSDYDDSVLDKPAVEEEDAEPPAAAGKDKATPEEAKAEGVAAAAA
ncbi:hypothetical protein HK405_003322 [Cladochytrium tenue]|nr:hypothetical protein HK405_003322 [Cladochytrium tenue]